MSLPPLAGMTLLVTCEHGGNRLPRGLAPLFAGRRRLLESHRGYDAGALPMARDLARRFAAPLFYSRTSRLVVDLNRSPGHPRLFSPMTRALPAADRERLMARHYRPYRERVEARVARELAAGRRVVHVSSHSFVGELDGELRNADIGLLYDPRRAAERALAGRWRQALLDLDPALRVRRNYPYAGRADGLTSWLRRRFPASRYLGIELEVNQCRVLAGGAGWQRLRGQIVAALEFALR